VAIDEGTREDAWVYDLARTSLSRLTMSGSAHSPLWHPNGTELIVASGRDRFVNLFRVDAGGGGIREPLSRTAAFECPTSISADGSVMTWSALDLESSSYNVGVGMPTAESQPPPYFDSPLWEMWPAISPDGEWVAFVSNRTGDPEVYVAPYPGPGPISQISNKGGVEPLWSDEGDELFYRQGEAMFSVAVDFDGTPKFGIPEKLFEGRFLMAEAGFSHEYDVTPDGRFLMIRSVEAGGKIDSGIQRINVVLNWVEELNALIPPSGSGN
jgi:serine/threonine-protein kinase